MRTIVGMALVICILIAPLTTPVDFGFGCCSPDYPQAQLILGFSWGYIFIPISLEMADILYHVGLILGVWS